MCWVIKAQGLIQMQADGRLTIVLDITDPDHGCSALHAGWRMAGSGQMDAQHELLAKGIAPRMPADKAEAAAGDIPDCGCFKDIVFILQQHHRYSEIGLVALKCALVTRCVGHAGLSSLTAYDTQIMECLKAKSNARNKAIGL